MQDPYAEFREPRSPEQVAHLEHLVEEVLEAKQVLDSAPRVKGNRERRDAQRRLDRLLRGELAAALLDGIGHGPFRSSRGVEARIRTSPQVVLDSASLEPAAQWLDENGFEETASLVRSTKGDPARLRGPLQRVVEDCLRAGKEFPERLLGVRSLGVVARLEPISSREAPSLGAGSE